MGQYTSGPGQLYDVPSSTRIPHSAYEAVREHSQRMAAFETMRSAYHPTGGPREGVITPSGHGMYRQVCSIQTLPETSMHHVMVAPPWSGAGTGLRWPNPKRKLRRLSPGAVQQPGLAAETPPPSSQSYWEDRLTATASLPAAPWLVHCAA